MGLRTKFNLVMLAALLVGLGLAAAFSYRVVREEARSEVLQQAGLIIEEASAVRGYTDKEVGPLLAAQSTVRFLPQTIPFFAAQSVFRALPSAYRNFAYKEAALNPTNPADRAADWQAEIINTFEKNPKLTELVTQRETPAGPTLDLARPITVDNKGCLGCHSTPQVAPASMLDLYGSEHGFGWKVGQTVGAQIVTVPMTVAITKANRMFILLISGLAAVFLVMLILLNLLLHYLVVRPVRRMSALASEVSLGNLDAPEYELSGHDEIASLSQSFNRMRRSMVNAMRLLEGAE